MAFSEHKKRILIRSTTYIAVFTPCSFWSAQIFITSGRTRFSEHAQGIVTYSQPIRFVRFYAKSRESRNSGVDCSQRSGFFLLTKKITLSWLYWGMLHWGMLPGVGYSRVRYTEVRYTEVRYTEVRYTDVGYTGVHSSRIRYTRRLPYADFRYPRHRYIKIETHLFCMRLT